MLTELDKEWLSFTTNKAIRKKDERKKLSKKEIEENITDIYISTKTKIAYLNTSIPLHDIFWKLPVLDYSIPKNGILKKSIKINCMNETETKELNNLINNEKNINISIISDLKTDKHYKDVRKIDIGICKKDLLSYRMKKKGAFYNCFAIIMRVLFEDKYKEVHIKIFNTGKLEIPGIRDEKLLHLSLNKLNEILIQLMNNDTIKYNKDNIQNVLINSNFSCGFFINRSELAKILKMKYNLQPIYDPCSYPGIQCKFYYNIQNKIHDGKCSCTNKCYFRKKKEKKVCTEVSFMIFRTGSVLIVGHCDEQVLNIVYKFIRKLLIDEHFNIAQNTSENYVKKKSIPKIRKKEILVSIK